MGAPVAGSSLRATVVRGGGLTLKGLVPRYRSRKVQMIFPLSGSERRGLVSLEAKKQRVSPTATFLSRCGIVFMSRTTYFGVGIL